MIPNFDQLLLLAGKWSFVAGATIYALFAIIVVKQTLMMSKNVNDKFNGVLIAFSYLHLAFSAFLILLTFVVL